MVVAAPDEIEVQPAANDAASRPGLVLVDDQGQRTVPLPLGDDLPGSQISVEHDGKSETYRGVLLVVLLERAGIPLGAHVRGDLLGRYIIVTARDGYSAVFSLAEIDPFFSDRPALLADRLNDERLSVAHGPLQLVVPGDKHRRRWVKQVITLEIRNAIAKPAARKP